MKNFTLNGVRVECDGEYCESDFSIFFYDATTGDELVMWTLDEWDEDASLMAVIHEAYETAAKGGPTAMIERFGAK